MTKIIVVRIAGQVGLPDKIARTLELLSLKKKFSCVIADDKMIGMLRKVQDYVAFGILEKNTLKQLLLQRAKKGKKKIQIDEKKADAFVKDFMQEKSKLQELDINPFFSLHPPRGGLKKSSKLLWPRGILGKNEKINELVMKML